MDIRNILDIISENSRPVKQKTPVSGGFGLPAMSLEDFLLSAGVNPQEVEIDEAKLAAPARPFPKDELNKYLSRTVGTDTGKVNKAGGKIRKSEKTKQDKFNMPYIHNKNVPIVDEANKEYDLEKLRAMITKRPAKVLKQNEKMQHSDGTASAFYNIGLPALKGLAVDEDTGEFVIIDTCPGAGACQTYCYAMKGGYIMWTSPSLEQSKLLNFLYNDPQGFMDMLGNEIEEQYKKLKKVDKKKGTETKLIIRWHDAGDFFSPEYLNYAYTLAKKYTDVSFYAYTKLANVAQGKSPANFKMNYSMGAKPKEEQQIDFATTKNSRVVPEVLFKDVLDRVEGKLVYKDQSSINVLKARIAAKYSVKPNTILTYDEMMKKPVSNEKGKYNVIVKPGDGDDSANRNDVLNTFLLMH